MRFVKENSLSLAFFALFAVCLVGHALSGRRVYNKEQKQHHQNEVGLTDYLTTGHFGETLAENWESEFLQMAIFVFLCAYLVQKGSAESKPLTEEPEEHFKIEKAPWPVRQGGWALKIYGHSLALSLALLFLISFVFHGFAGLKHFNEDRLEHGEEMVNLSTYFKSSEFWFESFQNWQSEFLSVAMLVVLSIFLRQEGSSQSKPIAAPYSKTGT